MADPKQLKHYEILSRLGEGGMGVVYRARDTRLGRTVALKMLPAELAGDAERSSRFRREANIASSINHPGIATLFDFDREGHVAFLTMELVEGPTLRQVLQDGPLPLEQLLDCAVQIAEALAAAHDKGVIHRDLKPENIMVAASGYYKVLDFGVARIEDDAPSGTPNTQTPTRTWATRAGTLLGTVTYMSPEQVQGQPTSARSDLFTLGSVIYELATGVSPFARNTDVSTVHAIAYEPPQSVTELRPELPEGFELILGKCLVKKPELRYESTADLAADLRALRLAVQSGSRTLGGLKAYRGVASRRRRRIAIGLITLAIVAASSWYGARLLQSEPTGVAARAPATAQPLPTAAPAAATHDGPPRVIVAFFENNSGDASADWVSRGLPEMLTTDLSRAQELEVIATQRLHDLLATAGYEDRNTLDRSTTAELARWAGADIVISGSVFKLGDRYRIDVQAYDIHTGTVAAAYKVEGTELFGLVEDLTTGLLDGLDVGTTRAPGLQQVTTSEDAFRAFSRGKGLYESLRYEEAAARFRDSIAADPEFALAWLHLSTSLFSTGDVEAGVVSLQQALAHVEALPPASRLLAQSLDAIYRERNFDKAERNLEELVARFPRNAEAYVWWGRAHSDLEQDPMRAMRRLRAALEIDPDYVPALVTLANELARLGSVEDARQLLRQTAERHPGMSDAIHEMMQAP